MGLEFLGRVRHSTLWLGVLGSLFGAVYFSAPVGIGFGAGALWSLANLWLLERIVVVITGERRGAWIALRRAALLLVANALLLGAGAWLLTRLPILPLAAGFTLPFAVIVLKAASSVLIGSVAWRRLGRSPWQGLALVAALAATVWLLSGAFQRAAAENGHAAPAAAAPAAEHGATAEPAGEAGHGAGGHQAKASGPKEFPNVFALLLEANLERPWVRALVGHPATHEDELKRVHALASMAFSLLVALLLTLLCIAATRDRGRVPGPLANMVETLVEKLYDFVVGILGPRYGPRYAPFLGSLFLYIWFMNLFGVFPLMASPTASLNVTFALAITVFVYVHFTAIKELGIVGWVDHLAGSPRSPIEWGLVPLMLPIHVIGELAKPVSLSCRLFGNIFGEDMLLVGFASLGVTALAATGLPFGLPLHFPFLFLALMTSTVQALVFTMLSTIYFLLMLPHDHAHHEGEAQHAH